MADEQQLRSQEQDQEQSIRLSSNNFQIVPYVKLDGVWIIADEMLHKVFDKLVEQGLHDVVFRRGDMQSAEQFISFCRTKGRILCFVVEDGECVGMAWLAPLVDHYAFGHFCFFREIWGEKTKEAGKLIFDYWFSFGGDSPLLDVIIGVVPEENDRASGYVEKIGMTTLGSIPNMFRDLFGNKTDATIHYLTREQHGQG